MARAWVIDDRGRWSRTLQDKIKALIWFSDLNQHWVFHLECPRRGFTIGYAVSMRSAKIQATLGAKTTGDLHWTKIRPDPVKLKEHS